MKNRCLAAALAAMVGVMSFMPVATAKAYYMDTCYRCGGYSSTYEVVGQWDETVGTRICEHGYEREADIQLAFYERVNYYCADCNVNWEQDEFAGLTWMCGHKD